MTAAPRGIATVKSRSKGRTARYSTPLTEVTTTPSGRPIRSSWFTEPFAVWNCAPAASTMEWRRPFGSIRAIRSPASNGPRLTPDGGCSTIRDSVEPELPARPEPCVADLDAGPGVQVLVALAHRHQHVVNSRLLLE